MGCLQRFWEFLFGGHCEYECRLEAPHRRDDRIECDHPDLNSAYQSMSCGLLCAAGKCPMMERV